AEAPRTRREPPREVIALAERCGAQRTGIASTQVCLRQTGTMRADAAHPWARFRARQTIMLDRPGFTWRARTGPLGLVSVTDALGEAGPRLTVTALGAFPLVRVAADDALTKGELMRYLAELPLAPDAILDNASLDWEVLGANTFRVAATHRGVRACVDLTLGSDGFVASAFAPDRPRLEGARTVERPWRCQLGEYRAHGGRQLPFAAEVAWTIDGAVTTVLRVRLEDWRLT
ncbi:MAG: DUF6544 family protein, partial [Caulobacteraceae bacterium]